MTTGKTIRKTPTIPAKRWKETTPPRRILAIRLQAMGDLVITLPYLQYLRKNLPEGTILDLVTREEVEAIPRNIRLFDRVYSIRGGRNVKKQFFYTCLLLPKLFLRRYDVVIDLQNNIISDYIRRSLMPKAWSVFNRYFPIAAGESTRLTIEAIGLGKCLADPDFVLNDSQTAVNLLKENGWDGESSLVVLNPAGAFITRNWPMENYVAFASLWIGAFPRTQFIMLGTELVAEKAKHLRNIFNERFIDLTRKTSPFEAFAVLQLTDFILSEDSGLMHMAWVSGISTMALFGSTRSDRARPLGDHSRILHSSDLECGNCMRATCLYSDTRCLTRYSPEFVFEQSMELWRRTRATSATNTPPSNGAIGFPLLKNKSL